MEFDFKGDRVPIEEVESITDIRKRLVSPGISLGALSPEAHETLSIAMNRIGAKSDSGEGGEDPARYKPRPNGDNASSAIKQIASGRFGVTAEYLNNCREIEIKIAQGAKPGEGGQLPGIKVSEMIAPASAFDSGCHAHIPSTPSRHLLDRGPGTTHLRPQADQSRSQGLRQAGCPDGNRHYRRRRRKSPGGYDPGVRPFGRDRAPVHNRRSSMPDCPGSWGCRRSIRS